jgi:DNA-binding MarR family transcriptional regulator
MDKSLQTTQATPQWARSERERLEVVDDRLGAGTGRVDKRKAELPEAEVAPEADEVLSDTAIGYLVRDVHRSLARALQSRIASHGVSMGQWFFLRALWDEDGLTQRELSQRVGMMEPTTVTALNGMERRGLVERVRNVHDRRKVNIFLTPKGRALQDVLMPCSIEVSKEATLGVSKTELSTTMDVLRRMVGNLTGTTLLDEQSLAADDETVGMA